MRANTNLFWILFVFFVLADAAYTIWSMIYYGSVEWVGTLSIGLTGIMSAFIAFYLGRVMSAQGGVLPEDRQDANIEDGDAEPRALQPVVVVAAVPRRGDRARVPRGRSWSLDRADRPRARRDHARGLGLRVLPRQLRALTHATHASGGTISVPPELRPGQADRRHRTRASNNIWNGPGISRARWTLAPEDRMTAAAGPADRPQAKGVTSGD